MGILDACQSRMPAMLADVERIIRFESPSDDHAAVAQSADLVADVLGARLAQSGIDAPAERIVVDGVVHLRWRLGSGARRVLLLGHHDTVWPHGTLEAIPFSVTNGVLRGPGCFDMAIGLVQAVHATAALAERDGADAVDGVTILVTGDEEVGSQTSRDLLEDEARGLDAVFVLESAGPGGSLKTERKGTSMYTVQANGKASHAGLDPESGINAGVELAHQLLAIDALGDPLQGTTVTPTSGRIGTTTNTVPATASVDVDVRASSASQLQLVDQQIHALVPVLEGASLAIAGGINRPPLELSSSEALFARASKFADEAGIVDLQDVAVGGASDGNFTAGIGVPTLDGLGGVGGGAHAESEHVVLAHVPHRTALLALLIQDVLKDHQ
jgi:glutamate carboxypeptidase